MLLVPFSSLPNRSIVAIIDQFITQARNVSIFQILVVKHDKPFCFLSNKCSQTMIYGDGTVFDLFKHRLRDDDVVESQIALKKINRVQNDISVDDQVMSISSRIALCRLRAQNKLRRFTTSVRFDNVKTLRACQ